MPKPYTECKIKNTTMFDFAKMVFKHFQKFITKLFYLFKKQTKA